MKITEYAPEAPHIYAMKTRLISSEKMKELAMSRDLEEFTTILKETRYGAVGSGSQPFSLIDSIKGHILKEKEFLEKITPEKPLCVMRALDDWYMEREALLVIEALARGSKPKKVYGRLASEILSKYEMGILAIDTTVQGIRRAIESIEDKEVRKSWFKALEYYGEIGSMDPFYITSLKRLIDRLEGCVGSLGNRDKREVYGLLCPLIDYYIMLYSLNARKLGLQRAYQLLSGLNGCRIRGDQLASLPDEASFVGAIERLLDAYRISHHKLSSVEDADMVLSAGTRRLSRRRCLSVYPGYPFKPSIYIALYVLLAIEQEDLMRIISGIVSGMSGEKILESLSI